MGKNKLSFNALEKEYDRLSHNNQSCLKGGYGYDPMPNGFCVFDSLSYTMFGTSD